MWRDVGENPQRHTYTHTHTRIHTHTHTRIHTHTHTHTRIYTLSNNPSSLTNLRAVLVVDRLVMPDATLHYPRSSSSDDDDELLHSLPLLSYFPATSRRPMLPGRTDGPWGAHV
eukprot:GHVU01151275.1.p2 GENE.GHVU01151275.1~~GHVU01151275.1.p2  ORF type:complete len:114 (+),score=5.84 GHVU01151275.1:660-1001(+)